MRGSSALSTHFGKQCLAPGQVQVWILRVDAPRSAAEGVAHVLNPGEKVRAARFHFERDMVRFVLTRACLRTLLANALGSDPASICFGFGAAGKPYVEGGPQFNVSHSGAYSLVALAQDRSIGVDVERMRPRIEDEALSAYFSRPEEQALRVRAGRDRVTAFYSCWTRKEAYLKARGAGLSFGLDRFAVTIAPVQPALVWVADEPTEPSRWQFRDLSVDQDYAAAIAAEGHGWELLCRKLSGLW